MGNAVGNTIRRLSSHRKVEPCDADPLVPTSPAEEGDMGKQRSQKSIDGKAALGRPFPKRPIACKLSVKVYEKIEEIFHKMDPDGSNAVTKGEAQIFFKGAFGKLSADAMFNEVDVDGSGAITAEEFVAFWIHVRKNGYKEQDIIDELDELVSGGAWVDWKDGKETGAEVQKKFPTRPLLCRLSAKAWGKCEELFKKMDTDGALMINHEKAAKHFTGSFTKMSIDAMFNEIDPQHHGQIPAREWMRFWVQVKTSGYKEQDIIDELDNLLEGGAWVDWKDGRSTA